MQYLTSNHIRHLFLDYFQKQDHSVVPSSSLVPQNDPTLLFTNAGMVPFKDVFLGKESRPYQRATSSQRCVRAGGKHNDLEAVGYTARHHTFFEMLGNFSFGDYFKREAIQMAWTFLTGILKLPPEKLWITIYKDDEETADIWLNELKVDPKRFSRCSEHSNFWSMGPTGPCGPCTEIFYDHGPTIAGGPPGSPDEDGDRYVEIWNLVFMQYDRAADGTLSPLPKPSIDTGMGLERITAVMQGVHSNYDIDIFKTLIKATADLAGITDLTQTSLRVIADHIRSAAFLILDGVTPLNEGRGYVLRRIIRRALRHGHQLGLKSPFFHELVTPLIQAMAQAYPELQSAAPRIQHTLRHEEEQFNQTLAHGLKLFDQATHHLQGKQIPGDIVFQLYDTYGFPVDLTADIARERQLTIDMDGFEAAMQQQRERSREASQFAVDYSAIPNGDIATEFTGYHLSAEPNTREASTILALIRDHQRVETLSHGEKGWIILDKTPFYAESGGQVGDQGMLYNDTGRFHVQDTQKQGKTYFHVGEVTQGAFKIGDRLFPNVDSERRTAIVINHTATHLLHATLRTVLGEHVIQKGSLVLPERLRFDFCHSAPMTPEEIQRVETMVNQTIRANYPAVVQLKTRDEAVQQGAMALFDEKYEDQVRVVQLGHSIELCGGTHAQHTGEVGLFKIISESGVAAGIRRIEAVTGDHALQWMRDSEKMFAQALEESETRERTLEKTIEHLKQKMVTLLRDPLAAEARHINDIAVIIATVDDIDHKTLRPLVDALKQKLQKAIIVLACVQDKKVNVIVGVTQNCVENIKAGELIKHIATQVGGKGGGRPDLAEAGGNQPSNLKNALDSAYTWIREKLLPVH